MGAYAALVLPLFQKWLEQAKVCRLKLQLDRNGMYSSACTLISFGASKDQVDNLMVLHRA